MTPPGSSVFPGINGFLGSLLGSRASLMLDIVFLAMFAVLPVMAWSIWLVKTRQRYLVHKRVQLTLGTVLLVAVTLFELDMRVTGWTTRARPSPYFDTWVYPSLYVHLFFAVPTAVLWVLVIVQALRKFPSPPSPGAHSPSHRFWGWLAAIEMTLTATTGWVFYYLAFVA